MRSHEYIYETAEARKAYNILVFNQIYQAAKNKSRASASLALLLNEGIFIDTLDPVTGLTPAGLLAKDYYVEGNKEAIEILIKFGASIREIACGAALGGQRAYAEALRQRYKFKASLIASYAAWGGNEEYALYLCEKHGASVFNVACCAMMGGHKIFAERLRLKFEIDLDAIALSAAFGNHLEDAEYFRVAHHANVNCIAPYAAKCGDRKYAEHLRQHHGAEADSIAECAAWGGQSEYAEYLRINHGANPNKIAEYAVKSGDSQYAEDLRTFHKAKVTPIAKNAAVAGLNRYVEYLYLNHEAALDPIVKGFAERGIFAHKNIALHFLSFIENNQFRAKIAYKCHDLKLAHEFNIIRLIPQAKRIRELRPQYSYSQCLALGNRDFQLWYQHCATLIKMKSLPTSLFFYVATFLVPLTFDHATDLIAKARFGMFKNLLIKNLDKQTHRHSFFKTKTELKNFKEDCAAAPNSSALKNLLLKEKSRITQNEQSRTEEANLYHNVLQRHLNRFG